MLCWTTVTGNPTYTTRRLSLIIHLIGGLSRCNLSISRLCSRVFSLGRVSINLSWVHQVLNTSIKSCKGLRRSQSNHCRHCFETIFGHDWRDAACWNPVLHVSNVSPAMSSNCILQDFTLPLGATFWVKCFVKLWRRKVLFYFAIFQMIPS